MVQPYQQTSCWHSGWLERRQRAFFGLQKLIFERIFSASSDRRRLTTIQRSRKNLRTSLYAGHKLHAVKICSKLNFTVGKKNLPSKTTKNYERKAEKSGTLLGNVSDKLGSTTETQRSTLFLDYLKYVPPHHWNGAQKHRQLKLFWAINQV